MNGFIGDKEEKRFMNVKEFCTYMGIGQTKARELISQRNGFALNIGGKWLIDKKKLEKWIDSNIK